MKPKRSNSKRVPNRARSAGSHERLVMQHRSLLKEILKHQVANLGSKGHEFYSCYTYDFGEMPPWVSKAKELLKANAA